MIRTSTPTSPHPGLPPRGVGALPTLRAGGLVLLPTANLWQMVTDTRQFASVKRMLSVCPVTATNRPELIFSDRATLLSWFPQLHPKLDTLLSYHGRILTVLTPANSLVPSAVVDRRGEVAVRLALDPFCHRLTKDLEGPLAAVLAMGDESAGLPTRFGRVRSDVLRASNFTVQRRQREDIDLAPAVRVRMKKGHLEFL
ncbi:hypothetical protein LEM8419_01667 [Neolewinella maritima]|uniref:YrdC-like domain-containing protein n=1 Tax=Neolewinella maritima TaxID=1383882 RepID=A0ABM9B0R8_9BACT|nr:Sua5/YciO/YrdC/YwlC family protein [Neolewinella maritima]CAH1000514.1 hypothetical protein LEM8419_01667 [Neolewinella maritima]